MTFKILIYDGSEQCDLQDDLAWVSGGPVLSHGPRSSRPRVLLSKAISYSTCHHCGLLLSVL